MRLSSNVFVSQLAFHNTGITYSQTCFWIYQEFRNTKMKTPDDWEIDFFSTSRNCVQKIKYRSFERNEKMRFDRLPIVLRQSISRYKFQSWDIPQCFPAVTNWQRLSLRIFVEFCVPFGSLFMKKCLFRNQSSFLNCVLPIFNFKPLFKFWITLHCLTS